MLVWVRLLGVLGHEIETSIGFHEATRIGLIGEVLFRNLRVVYIEAPL